MRLYLPDECTTELRQALRKAGTKEIGGQIFGEQLAPSQFLVTELTVQKRMGSFARFVVDLVQATRDAFNFFERTKHRYTQFNYVGEWHSHPSFEISPSHTDICAMKTLAEDPDFRGSFAVLMILKLDGAEFKARAWVFDPSGSNRGITLEYSTPGR